MSPDPLLALASAFPGEVVVVPGSIDEAITLVAGPSRLLVAIDPTPAMLGALAAAVRGTSARVVAGTRAELTEMLPEVAGELGPGRCVLARDWRLDPEATLWGRRGLALAPPLSDDRPRTLAESPLPLSSVVRDALRTTIERADLRRYPPMLASTVIAAVAKQSGVRPEHVVVAGDGSLGLLQRLLRAFADPGDEVFALRPTFDGFAEACAREGLVLRLGDDPERIGSSRLAYVVRPEVPGGVRVGDEVIERLRRALGGDRIVILDEAYLGFDEVQSLVDLTPPPDPARAPVVVLRSLSKLDGLAGLRIGFALGPAPVMTVLRRLSRPYALTELQAAAAIAALEDESHREQTRAVVRRTRERIVSTLRALGFEVPDSTTHLLLVRPPPDRFDEIAAVAESEALPLEESPQHPGAFQLSVPEPDIAERLLARLAAVGQGGS